MMPVYGVRLNKVSFIAEKLRCHFHIVSQFIRNIEWFIIADMSGTPNYFMYVIMIWLKQGVLTLSKHWNNDMKTTISQELTRRKQNKGKNSKNNMLFNKSILKKTNSVLSVFNVQRSVLTCNNFLVSFALEAVLQDKLLSKSYLYFACWLISTLSVALRLLVLLLFLVVFFLSLFFIPFYHSSQRYMAICHVSRVVVHVTCGIEAEHILTTTIRKVIDEDGCDSLTDENKWFLVIQDPSIEPNWYTHAI